MSAEESRVLVWLWLEDKRGCMIVDAVVLFAAVLIHGRALCSAVVQSHKTTNNKACVIIIKTNNAASSIHKHGRLIALSRLSISKHWCFGVGTACQRFSTTIGLAL